MKTILLLISFMIIATDAAADGAYLFTGINAFDDTGAEPEYTSQSPNGVIGFKFEHNISDRLYLEMGVKHESSIVIKEEGKGLNSFFTIINMKIY